MYQPCIKYVRPDLGGDPWPSLSLFGVSAEKAYQRNGSGSLGDIWLGVLSIIEARAIPV